MPKYRKLPLTVIDSLDMADMPDDFTRLTWLMLPLIVCKNGRAVDLPQWLVSKLYPARTDVDAGMIAAAMDWYESRKMIRRYEVDGRRYFELVNWTKHQGDTSREAESPYPDPPPHELVQSDETYTTQPVQELVVSSSGVGQELVVSSSRSMQSNSKGNSKGNSNAAARQRGAPAPDAAATAATEWLEQFGLTYNDKTAPLVGLSPDYIQAHLDYARENGEKTGLAIRRMLDGDPRPKTRPTIQDQVPIEYRDIIKQ